ncbi:MAG: dihydropteroate synthase-like protein [Candidatus Bathyarchaeia archaeon]
MVKALLITGQLAKKSVSRYAARSPIETQVFDLPVSVAALMTAEYIARQLKGEDFSDFDFILVPGLVRGDISEIEGATGVAAFKGPRYAADIPAVLELPEGVKLSRVVPADDLLRKGSRRGAEREIAMAERDSRRILEKKAGLIIGLGKESVVIGQGLPMRIVAEIVDAPLLSDREIRERAKYYVDSGANIVDVGMMAGDPRPEDAARAVSAVKKAVSVPASIDTMDPEEAKAAISAGVDLVLSIDGGNVEEMARFIGATPAVIVPTDHRRGYAPKQPLEKVRMLEKNIRKALRSGIKTTIADPILEPANVPGIFDSLVAYYEFAKRHPKTPLLFGVGNVTELIDADSIGVNAIMASIASEVGACLLFTAEGSDKTRGCVRELSTAARMMFIAKRRGSVPKDLGLDLLRLKDKRIYEEAYDRRIEKVARSVSVKKTREPAADSMGCFKIMLDRKKGILAALHFPLGSKKPDLIIKGKTAAQIQSRIIDEGLVFALDHAMYLGHELSKAEMALRIGKSYVQDLPLFG